MSNSTIRGIQQSLDQEAIYILKNKIKYLEADLAAARALLKEAHGWLDPWESRQSALRDRIDAAIAGEKK